MASGGTPSGSTSVAFFERPDQIDAMIKKYRHDTIDSDDEDDVVYDDDESKQHFVDAGWFNMIVAALISANALTIGLEADQSRHGGSQGWWYIIEVCFVIVFAFELILRLRAHGWAYFSNSNDRIWNIVDFVIVLMSVIDSMLLMPLGLGTSLRFVSMLRFVRLLRLVRLVRLLRFFRELWLVASGLLQAVKTLLWVVMVLFVLCYISSIISTLMIGKNHKNYNDYFKESKVWDHETYFRNMPIALLTFLQIVTFDNWSEVIMRHAGKEQPLMYVFFILFVCLASFLVLNLMIGVVVERAVRSTAMDAREQKRKRDKDRNLVFNQLKDIFESADVDHSGTLSLQEVEDAINKPEIYNKLRMIDFPVENPQEVFVLLDYDNTGELTIEEFIKGCLRMKGPAMSKDLLVAQVALDGMAKQYKLFESELKEFKAKLQKLDGSARALANLGEKVFLDPTEYRARHPDLGIRSRPTKMRDIGMNGESPFDRSSLMRRRQQPQSMRQAAQAEGHAQLEGPSAPPALPDGYVKQKDRPMPMLDGPPGPPGHVPIQDGAQLAIPGSLAFT